MIRPLKELLKGIRSISNDRFGKPIRVRSKDEFGKLANAFNEMAVQLKEEERMRSDFIGMLSHEIRTPLTSTRESVNMIVEEVMGEINPRQRKFLEIASTEIGRICDLLNHLMQVSRLESINLNIKQEPIKTSAFVSGCISRLGHVADTKNIRIAASIPSELPDILGDPEYLQRVFYNLMDNAIKFSVPGSKINVGIKPTKNRANLLFFVKDNGPGIPEEEQSLIFNKYYQARNTRDNIDGVGLGLNISKHIIEAHGGDIWVESKDNQGSTFCFSLPVAGRK
jgi:signal transduction histidine kinase